MAVLAAGSVGLRVSMLGPFDVQVNGQSLGRRHSRKENWLLALLALRNGKEVSREWLAGTLWPGTTESQSLGYVRQNVYLVKRSLGDEAFRLQSPTSRTLRLDLSNAEVDVIAFDLAVRNGDLAALERAVALYCGPLLEGCDEDWVVPERQVREQAYLQCLETLAEQATARGEPCSALPLLRRLVQRDPLRESAHRSLMRALAADGNLGAMSRAYRDLRLILHQEVNSEPDPESSALYQQLRTASPGKSVRHDSRIKPRLVGGSNLPIAAGSALHHESLRTDADSDPVRVTDDGSAAGQTAPAEAKPPPAGRTAKAGHLPTPITPLVGREELVREVIGSLSRSRLVTLTGTGGVGKTRVAIDACRGYLDAVWYVELAPVREALHVPTVVAKVLGVAEQKDAAPVETIALWLAARSGLLVLDNCEHLLESSAQLCARLLMSCPGLRILTTSRQVLGILGETAIPVPALETPPPQSTQTVGGMGASALSPAVRNSRQRTYGGPVSEDDLAAILMEYDSVRLYVERAQAVSSGFMLTAANGPLVAQICRRLDGIPLAIELTAARAGILSPRDILTRLDDRFNLLTRGNRHGLPHHQTLRASVEWSYNLLSVNERRMLNRLAVFAGGWSLEAAEQIVDLRAVGAGGADAALPANDQELKEGARAGSAWNDAIRSGRKAAPAIQSPDTLDLLSSLVDKSLVVAVPSESAIRYHLLETIREYAVERLCGSGDWQTVHKRHYAYFLDLMTKLKKQLWSDRNREATRQLELEHDNLRAALRWSLEESEIPSQALLLSAEISNFWLSQGYFSEARAWLGTALKRVDEKDRTEARAYALQQAGVMAFVQSDLAPAISLMEESIAIRRENDTPQTMANALLNLGSVYRITGDIARATSCAEESLAIYRRMGHQSNVATALNNLGNIYLMEDDLDRAAEYLEESITLYRDFVNREKMAVPMSNLGIVVFQQGDNVRARLLHEETLRIHEEHGNRPGVANAQCNLSQVAKATGDYETAGRLLRAGLRGWTELGSKREMIVAMETLASIAVKEWQALPGAGEKALHNAARICGAAASLRESLHLPRERREEEQYQQTMADIKQALADGSLAASWKAGQSMSAEEAAAFALEMEQP